MVGAPRVEGFATPHVGKLGLRRLARSLLLPPPQVGVPLLLRVGGVDVPQLAQLLLARLGWVHELVQGLEVLVRVACQAPRLVRLEAERELGWELGCELEGLEEIAHGGKREELGREHTDEAEL